MTKKLPATIYVKWDTPSDGEFYLLADNELYGLVETGGKRTKIGTYRLVETTEAEMVVSTSKPIKAPAKP